MKKYNLILLIAFFISCKENLKKPLAIDNTKIEKKSSLQIKITIPELQSFERKLNAICVNNDTKILTVLTDNVSESYPEFCEMFKNAKLDKDGEIQFDIDEIGKGIITINSVELIEDDGEKYRNEYSTFIYVIKIDDKLIINEIGGAG